MFNDIIVENFSNPAFAGEMEGADMALELGNPVCGDRIKVQLKLDGDQIQQVRYQAWGCATSLATGNIFCAYADGQPLDKVLATSAEMMEQLLGELEPAQHHCLEMLQALFAQLKQNLQPA